MNIVSTGNQYIVYGDDVQTYKRLPNRTFDICFNKMSGFYLCIHDDLTVKDRIYGNIEEKVQKVLRTFKTLDRNMGVILSGPKGVGKSMFARELARSGNKAGLPLIICNEAYPNVETFIGSIDQECIVLFDEFEKTFKKEKDTDYDPQEDLLPLFDGLDNGKKLFVITCNNPDNLNEYLLNRPGRFYYHFCLSAPSENEVRAYLKDNLHRDVASNIDEIVALTSVSNFTYDVLRALCFELNQGYSLKESLEDLNIERNRTLHIIFKVVFENGVIGSSLSPINVDLANDKSIEVYIFPDEKKISHLVEVHLDYVNLRIQAKDIKADKDGYSVDTDKVLVGLSDDYFDIEENDDTTEVKRERQEYKILKEQFRKIKSIKLVNVNDEGFNRKWSV